MTDAGDGRLVSANSASFAADPRAATAARVVLRDIRRHLKNNMPGDMDSMRLWEALLAKHFGPKRREAERRNPEHFATHGRRDKEGTDRRHKEDSDGRISD